MDVFSYLLGKKSSGGGGGGFDWSQLGYSKQPQYFTDDIAYAKNIYDNWDNTVSDCYRMYKDNDNIVYFPVVDLSNATTINEMFYNAQRLEYAELNLNAKAKASTGVFNGCRSLREVKLTGDVSSYTNFGSWFKGCQKLKTVPVIDMSSCSMAQNMFQNCFSLSTQSLDNILVSLINSNITASVYKTLTHIGFTSQYQPSATIQALPHYQAFIDAGWTIGY